MARVYYSPFHPARTAPGAIGTSLPPTRNVPRGNWATNTLYDVGDIFTHNGSSYLVYTRHTSSGTEPDLTKVRLLASAGVGGIAGTLTNETHAVPTSYDGSIVDYSTAIGEFQVFSGGNEVTIEYTYAVDTRAGSNPQGLTVSWTDPDAGDGLAINNQYNVTGGFNETTEDVARVRLVATPKTTGSRAGTTPIYKWFTLSKAKAGFNSFAAYLTNETHTLTARADGTVINYNGASGKFNVFYGGANVTANCDLAFTNPQGLIGPYSGGPVNTTTGDYQVTDGFGTNEEIATIVITAKGKTGLGLPYAGLEQSRTFSLSKSKGGVNAPLVRLRSNKSQFSYGYDNSYIPKPLPTTQMATFTADHRGGTLTSYSWQLATIDGTPVNTTEYLGGVSSITDPTVTLTAASFDAARQGTEGITLTCTANITSNDGTPVSVSDSVSIVRSVIGARAVGLELVADRRVVNLNNAGNPAPSNQTITFSYNKVNTNASVYFQLYETDGVTLIPNPGTYMGAGDGLAPTQRHIFNRQLTHSSWTKFNLTSVQDAYIRAPNGTLTGSRINTGTDLTARNRGIRQDIIVGGSGENNTVSSYFKAGTAEFKYMWILVGQMPASTGQTGLGTFLSLCFNLETGTFEPDPYTGKDYRVVNTSYTGAVRTYLESAPEGWYKPAMFFAAPPPPAGSTDTNSTLRVYYYGSTSSTSPTAPQTLASSFWYIWNPQVTRTSSPIPPIESLSSTELDEARFFSGSAVTMTAANFNTLRNLSTGLDGVIFRGAVTDNVSGQTVFDEITINRTTNGADGLRPDLKFIRSDNARPVLTSNTDPNPTSTINGVLMSWADTPPEAQTGAIRIWMIRATKRQDGTMVGRWTTPRNIQGLVQRGPFASTNSYVIDDVVSYNGGSYVALQGNPSPSIAPSGTSQPNSYWDVLSAPPETVAPSGTTYGTSTAPKFVTIPTGTNLSTANLRTLADTHATDPYNGGDAYIVYTLGAVGRIAATGSNAIDTGTWPTGKIVTLILRIAGGGFVIGGGGAGGDGGSWLSSGGGGANGAHAVNLQHNLTIEVGDSATANAAGTIYLKAGSKGGVGGASGYELLGGELAGERIYYGGGGGGGGYPNGPGGTGGEGDGGNGTAGTAGSGGNGTAAGSGGGAGGAGVAPYSGSGGSGNGLNAEAPSESAAGNGFAIKRNGKTRSIGTNANLIRHGSDS